jgi:trk system potassium uptake protein TrkH
MNNVGPGLNLVGPLGNFSIFSPLSKATLTALMIVGRLEVFPMLLLFSRSLWRDS